MSNFHIDYKFFDKKTGLAPPCLNQTNFFCFVIYILANFTKLKIVTF